MRSIDGDVCVVDVRSQRRNKGEAGLSEVEG